MSHFTESHVEYEVLHSPEVSPDSPNPERASNGDMVTSFLWSTSGRRSAP